MSRTKGKAGPRRDYTPALKIDLRGKDRHIASMTELRDGLFEAVAQLLRYQNDCRTEGARLYVSLVDKNGRPVRINKTNTLTIDLYSSAADEHSV